MGAALAAIRRRWAWTALLMAGALAGTYAMLAAATRGSLVALPILAVLAAVALLRRARLRPLLAGTAILGGGHSHRTGHPARRPHRRKPLRRRAGRMGTPTASRVSSPTTTSDPAWKPGRRR